MKKTLIYIDPGYDAEFGHYVRTSGLIKNEAEKQGITMRHYVNLNVPEQLASDRILERRFVSRPGLDYEENSIEVLRDFYHSLDGILGEIPVDSDDEYTIFMYTGHPFHLPPIALAVNKHAERFGRLTAYACLFYLDLDFCKGEGSDDYKNMLSTVSGLIDLADPGMRLTVCVDSERTRKLYVPFFQREIEMLPFPIEVAPDSISEQVSGDKDKIRICYIGQTTRRAGYDLMYEAYRKISAEEWIDKVEFMIKHTPRTQLYDLFQKFVKDTKNVRHESRFLSNEQIMKLIDECDIILVPYSKEEYPTQTSAMVVEALFRHKILIVPNDTWMSDQLEEFGAGETFESGNVDSFVDAIHKVVESVDFYKERASRNIDRYYSLHSVEKLFADLGLSTISGVEQEDYLRKISKRVDEGFEKYFIDQTIGALRLWNYYKLLKKKEYVIENLKSIIDEKNTLINNKEKELQNKGKELQYITDSICWKLTAPFRWLHKKIK